MAQMKKRMDKVLIYKDFSLEAEAGIEPTSTNLQFSSLAKKPLFINGLFSSLINHLFYKHREIRNVFLQLGTNLTHHFLVFKDAANPKERYYKFYSMTNLNDLQLSIIRRPNLVPDFQRYYDAPMAGRARNFHGIAMDAKI